MKRSTRILAWFWIIALCLPYLYQHYLPALRSFHGVRFLIFHFSLIKLFFPFTILCAIPWAFLLLRHHLRQAIGWWIIVAGMCLISLIYIREILHSELLNPSRWLDLILSLVIPVFNLHLLLRDPPKFGLLTLLAYLSPDKREACMAQHAAVSRAAAIPAACWRVLPDGAYVAEADAQRFTLVFEASAAAGLRTTLLIDDVPVALHDPGTRWMMNSPYLGQFAQQLWHELPPPSLATADPAPDSSARERMPLAARGRRGMAGLRALPAAVWTGFFLKPPAYKLAWVWLILLSIPLCIAGLKFWMHMEIRWWTNLINVLLPVLLLWSLPWLLLVQSSHVCQAIGWWLAILLNAVSSALVCEPLLRWPFLGSVPFLLIGTATCAVNWVVLLRDRPLLSLVGYLRSLAHPAQRAAFAAQHAAVCRAAAIPPARWRVQPEGGYVAEEDARRFALVFDAPVTAGQPLPRTRLLVDDTPVALYDPSPRVLTDSPYLGQLARRVHRAKLIRGLAPDCCR